MVISLAQDKRNYSAEELVGLTKRIREGDLTDVLKLYEDDIKVSPPYLSRLSSLT